MNEQAQNHIAIAICGESGAGKTTTTGLIRARGFRPCSVSGFLRDEAESVIDSPSRAQIQDYGRRRQEEEGDDYFARRMLTTLSPFNHPRSVIDGLRNLAELQLLRQVAAEANARFVLLALMTPDAVRFERVQSRGRNGDPRTLDEFMAADERARGAGGQNFQQNAALIEAADERIINSGDLDTLNQQIDHLLAKVMTS